MMNESYDGFQNLEDFLESKRFQAWVKGERPEDKVFWEGLLSTYPERAHVYKNAVGTLLILAGTNEDISAEYIRDKVGNIISAIEDSPKTVPFRGLRLWLTAAAAVIAVGIGWYSYITFSPAKSQERAFASESTDAGGWQQTENKSSRVMLVNFPDGSSVLLSRGSKIRFEKKMDHVQREVYLEGEGFFEVAKNAARPFFVYTNGLTTKVLGTSFRVRAYENEPDVTVAVRTGKVTVVPGSIAGSSNTSKALTLLPDQEVSLLKEKEKFVYKTNGQESNHLSGKAVAPNPMFEFRFTPVARVFAELEKVYGVPIVYDQEKMRNCTLTATLTDEPFLDKVKLICLGTESTFKMSGNSIIIQSTGCP